MLGGGGANANTMFPGFAEENRIAYDNNSLPRLQLFGQVPAQHGAGIESTNYTSNEHASNNNGGTKRVRENDPICIGTHLNSNRVSTGLRLSYDEEERNSSVTSAGENAKNASQIVLSFGNSLKMEIDRHSEEVGRYFKIQEDNILKGVRELNQRHTFSLVNALEKRVQKKLHEKDLEIENINLKNKELGDKIKQVSMEAQSWHYKAEYSESVVNVLKNNIQQLMAQNPAQAREGSGDNEMDDAVSCTNYPANINYSGNQIPLNHRVKCRSCNDKEVSILLLPCRHLCLCKDCERLTGICPICQGMKSERVRVYM